MVAPFDLDSLNDEQRDAVMHSGGPLLIFAGAGSGKTRVITYRIARIVADGTFPSRILAVTFTNKAAKEMRERIERLIGNEAKRLWMGTFHSICARILRIDGHHLGISTDFVIFDDGDQMTILKEIYKELNLDDKVLQPRVALYEISRAKERLIKPDRYATDAASHVEKLVARIYPKYQAKLAKSNALDFDDIICRTVDLLVASPEVLQSYANRFEHVLIDEYQDVNFAQYRLAQLLSSHHQNLTIVGDDDQSIYGWRGADLSLMMRFGSDHPNAKIVTLGQNYRCSHNILSAASDVIQHNRGRAKKELWTENDPGQPITITEVGTEHEEAMLIADTLMQEVKAGHRQYSDYGVLYRTNAQSRVIEEAFLTMRIPHILVGGRRFYERKEVKDMLSYLRLVLNPADDISMRRVINVPTRGLGGVALGVIDDWASGRGLNWWDALKEQTVQAQLQKKALFGVLQFIGLIEEGRDVLAERGQISAVLRHIMTKSGYVQELKTEHSDESISRLENLNELLNVTIQYDSTAEEPTLAGFLESVTLISDVDQLNEDGNTVTLMTLHSSKGLEFPVVFLAGAEEGVFPHSRSIGSELELEEERRLAYVGITRAREELHLLHARRRTVFGNSNFNRRSRFLDDIVSVKVDSLIPVARASQYGLRDVQATRSGEYQISPPAARKLPDWTPPFTVGQRVRHHKFGEGVIIACSPLKNDAEVTVAFPGVVGVKKLVQSLAKLEPV